MNHSHTLAALALAALLGGGRVEAQPTAQTPRAPASDWGSSGEINAFQVQGSVYLLVGAGGNIAVQIGDDGVLVVDAGLAAHAEKVLAAIRKLSDKPIRYIINTHVHPDHTGGNEVLASAGSTTEGSQTTVIAHENVLVRMSAPAGKPGAAAPGAWPTDTYLPDEKDIFFNKEPILIYHDKAGHTDGDSMVLFRRSDVIVTGDIFNMSGYPVIDQASGGSVNGVLAALNRVLDLAVPEHEQEGGTYVIPGHGRVCDEADVLEYRDMVTIVKERIEEMAKRGMTLEQVKAARPTLDYDRHYGAETGPWTTAMFVEAIYKDVSGPAARSGAKP